MSDTSTEPSQASPAPDSNVRPDEALDRTPVKAKDARAKMAADLAAKRAKAAAESDDDDAPAPKKSTTDDKKEKSTDDDKKAKGSESKDKPAETALEKKIESKELKLEEAGIDVNQKKNESDADYDLRLAKLIREKDDAIREAKKQGAEAAKLIKLIEAGKANPLTILDHLGVSYEDLVKGINAKKYTAPGAKPQVPQEILDQIAELKKDKTDREAAEQARALSAQAKERMEKDTKKVQSFLDANADEFPFMSSVPWAVQEILARANASKATDVLPIIRGLEENLANNTEKLVMSDKAMKAAIKKNPELKALLKKLFDDEPEAKPAAKKSKDEESDDDEVKIRGLDDLTRDPPARSTKKTRAELKAEMAAELRGKRSKRGDDDD